MDRSQLFQCKYNDIISELSLEKIPFAFNEISDMWESFVSINEEKGEFNIGDPNVTHLAQMYIMEYYHLAMAVGNHPEHVEI